MSNQGGPGRLRNLGIAVIFVALIAVATVPGGFGVSSGITTQTTPALDPSHGGCTSCHGGSAFATAGATVTVTVEDSAGAQLAGPYHAGDVYTITINLDEVTGLGANNQAGFHIGADGGVFTPVSANVQVTDDGLEATHTNAQGTSWTMEWTAPDAGTVVFRWYVNDVDGSGSPDAPDQVYTGGFWIADKEGAAPGAVEEHEPHVGVPLPQYWLGIIALASMIIVMMFGYVYLKYASPHNTDKKDR